MKDILAVVVAARDHYDYLRAMMDSLRRTELAARCILVDDGSACWSETDWSKWPPCLLASEHFEQSQGTTAAWNHGMAMALDTPAEYIVLANSDVLFTQGWWPPLRKGLEQFELLGPLTNAPGHCPRQRIDKYLAGYQLTDDVDYLDTIAARLRIVDCHCVPATKVNGFCMVAKAGTWRQHRYDAHNVFSTAERCRDSRQEDEFQGRLRAAGGRIGICTESLVFHYRGVTRGHMGIRGPQAAGWYRPS